MNTAHLAPAAPSPLVAFARLQRVLDRALTSHRQRPLPRIEEPVVAAPADVNRFVEGGDHLTLRCELHDIDRLLTSVPIVVGTAGATELGFRTTKARMFPHSWNAVQAASNLPAESLIGEPPRFLVRCCPACRAAARKFLEAQALA